MIRSVLCLALGLGCLLAWPAAAFGQRCPFNMQAQVQVQIQWQRQSQTQSQLMRQQLLMQQQQRAAMQRNIQLTALRQNQLPIQRRMQPMIPQRSLMPVNRSLSRPSMTRTQLQTFSRVTRIWVPKRGVRARQKWGRVRPQINNRVSTIKRFTAQARTSKATTRQQDFTSQRKQTVRRPLARVTASVQPRRPTTPLQQRRPNPPRPQVQRQERKTTTSRDLHRPTVQLRVRMTGTCGSCHQCTQNRPSVVNLPNRMPFQIGPNQPVFDRPWLPRNPAPMVRLPGPNLRPQVPVVQPAQRFIVQQRPILQLPALPPLGITRIADAPKPTPSLLSDTPTRTEETIAIPAKPRPTSDAAPALPALDGGVVRLSPLLSTPATTERPRVKPAPVSDLAPASVVTAPTLPALAGQPRLMPGLLPTLDGDNTIEEARPALVELVLRAPPLPPLPEPNVN